MKIMRLLIVALGVHFLGLLYTEIIGRLYSPIVDFGFKVIPYVPEIPGTDILPYLYVIITGLVAFKKGHFYSQYLHGITILILMRSVSVVSTIFPKANSDCIAEHFLRIFLHGGCYDTVFSGHLAYMVYATFCFDHWIQPQFYKRVGLYLGTLIQGGLMIAIRAPYTVDILVAVYIAWLLYRAQYLPLNFQMYNAN